MTLNVYGAFLPSAADREHWRGKVTEAEAKRAESQGAGSKGCPGARGRSPAGGAPVLHLDDQAHPRAQEFPADVTTLNKLFAHDELRDCLRQLLKR
jgi:hypothetical protein